MGHAVAYALLAGGANILGALLVAGGRQAPRGLLHTTMALAAGFLLAVALSGLLPEAVERVGGLAGVAAVAGFVGVHLAQQLAGGHAPHDVSPPTAHPRAPHAHPPHDHTAHDHAGHDAHAVDPHPFGGAHTHLSDGVTAVGSVAALAALSIHTVLDGVAIASAEGAASGLGQLVFMGVVLHKLPEGLAIASLFLAAGLGRARAVGAAVVLAVAILAGVLITGVLQPRGGVALGISAGVTLYVAGAVLVPELRAHRGRLTTPAFLLGAALAVAATLLADRA